MYIKARLEAMTTIYGKTENSPPSKYKMAKDIQTPPRIYDYVAELSCCAKSKQIGPPNFAGEIGEVSDFYSSSSFFFTHTISQSIKQILSFRLQITNMEESEIFTAQNARFHA